jgi:predicted nucleic-acid-binding protein
LPAKTVVLDEEGNVVLKPATYDIRDLHGILHRPGRDPLIRERHGAVKGVDTNLLVRYLLEDDPDQAAIVDRLIRDTVAEGTVVFLNHIVLCETVGVLGTGYDCSRAVIADAFEKLLLTRQFEFEERGNVWDALRRFRDGKADFADYLIEEKNLSSGCDPTRTFDQGLRGEDGFELLGAEPSRSPRPG